MKVSSRRGLRRVAGGFALDVGRFHVIVSKRPNRDYNGFATLLVNYRIG